MRASAVFTLLFSALICIFAGVAIGYKKGERDGREAGINDQTRQMHEFFEKEFRGTRKGEFVWRIYETGVQQGLRQAAVEKVPINLSDILRLELIADRWTGMVDGPVKDE